MNESSVGGWKHGDRVWYKDMSHFEARPVLFTVVAENDGMVWVKDELEDKLVFSHELSPHAEGEEDEIG